ncbi:UNVERIFIED_CONTAM: hypothetical protein Sradi_0291200 [Sesamum radiatum]|uniref:Uncharacterized protein n=1 Tax=Sesamum radiatum TaxID=300843 RepID=A0AAW2W389_SESRA
MEAVASAISATNRKPCFTAGLTPQDFVSTAIGKYTPLIHSSRNTTVPFSAIPAILRLLQFSAALSLPSFVRTATGRTTTTLSLFMTEDRLRGLMGALL